MTAGHASNASRTEVVQSVQVIPFRLNRHDCGPSPTLFSVDCVASLGREEVTCLEPKPEIDSWICIRRHIKNAATAQQAIDASDTCVLVQQKLDSSKRLYSRGFCRQCSPAKNVGSKRERIQGGYSRRNGYLRDEMWSPSFRFH